jgi:hypothetical protein
MILSMRGFWSRGTMRGSDKRPGELFSYVDLEQRIRLDDPLRATRALTDTALAMLSGDFAALYSGMGRPSIAPEMLLRAMLLQAFYSIRSERQLMERLEFDLLSAGLSGWAWTIRCGTTRPSRRTATGCWRVRSRPGSCARCWLSRGSSDCCRASTFRWTAP